MGRSKSVDSPAANAQLPGAKSGKGHIRKRSPLEQAIAERTDRRARYDRSMREQGFKRTSIWVREDCLPLLQRLVKAINGSEGDHRKTLAELVERMGGQR